MILIFFNIKSYSRSVNMTTTSSEHIQKMMNGSAETVSSPTVAKALRMTAPLVGVGVWVPFLCKNGGEEEKYKNTKRCAHLSIVHSPSNVFARQLCMLASWCTIISSSIATLTTYLFNWSFTYSNPTPLQKRHVATVLWPYVWQMVQACRNVYSVMPVDLISALVGLVWCFCGGLYPTVFAAVEAAR